MSPNAAAPHDHVFLGENHARNERRTWAVIALTATMMVAEITAGTIYGSMALLADGWHMSTHASALLITALAYRFARKHARNPRFTFGTGKLGDLAAFGSATVLAIVALLIGWESLVRLRSPVPISFDEAILVADRIIALNPDGTLGEEFSVSIPRPRDRTEMNQDDTFKRLRAEVTKC